MKRSPFSVSLLGMLLTLAMLVSMFSLAAPVVADYDPPDSNASSIS